MADQIDLLPVLVVVSVWVNRHFGPENGVQQGDLQPTP